MKTIYKAEQQVKYLQLSVEIESLLLEIEARKRRSDRSDADENKTPTDSAIALREDFANVS